MSHAKDLGYDLHASLFVSDNGASLVSPIMYMTTKEGMLCSNHAQIQKKKSHLDALTDKIDLLENQGFSKPIIHIIDREADSVGHLRDWTAKGKSAEHQPTEAIAVKLVISQVVNDQGELNGRAQRDG